jgi:glutamate-1-semialdehyde 2,1-aminomutase
MTKDFTQSNIWFARAEKTIPLGSQTFSKSKISFPKGVAPLFIKRGQGCQVWDADDNQYIDFVSGLLSVSLGYCDRDVYNAVIEQIKLGVTFSLPHQLEMEVAEQLLDLIPCAEMVRFGKNGSDATTAAVRLARAFTGREHVAVCGYHGWQDWYIGSTTRDLGVPNATKALTHAFQYNDIDSLEKIFIEYSEQISAVIMEPMNVSFPQGYLDGDTENQEPLNFLQQVKALCHQYGALFILDETITGFRFSLGGAQELFDVTPDLATFGKGMANGYPLSAVVGRKDIMMLMEDIFFSGTFAGETLSLAATKATLCKIQNEQVLEHIHAMGTHLMTGLEALIEKYQAQHWLSLAGHPAWSFLVMADAAPYSVIELKSLFLQEMLERGMLLGGGGHNLNYAHKEMHIDALLNVYDDVLSLLSQVIKELNFSEHFRGELLQPVFKVR